MQVAASGGYGCVAKPAFDDIHLSSLLKSVKCEAVAQGMDAPTFGYASLLLGVVENSLRRSD